MDNKKIVKECQVCDDGKLHYQVKNVSITRRGLSAIVESVAGWHCNYCSEIDFDELTDSGDRYAKVGDELVLKERKIIAENLKSYRKKLKITQVEASLISGGGHNAFSRYETGNAQPVAGVVNFFELLSRHPELLKEVREISEARHA